MCKIKLFFIGKLYVFWNLEAELLLLNIFGIKGYFLMCRKNCCWIGLIVGLYWILIVCMSIMFIWKVWVLRIFKFRIIFVIYLFFLKIFIWFFDVGYGLIICFILLVFGFGYSIIIFLVVYDSFRYWNRGFGIMGWLLFKSFLEVIDFYSIIVGGINLFFYENMYGCYLFGVYCFDWLWAFFWVWVIFSWYFWCLL